MSVSGDVLLILGVIVFISANAFLLFIKRKNAVRLKGAILPITYDQMPEDNADLAKIEIDFPFLKDNSLKNCPIGMQEIQDYLQVEDADLDEVEHRKLTFLRTAQVAEKSYWIWKYNESDGTECYVTVSLSQDGSTVTGMNENYDELSPEQYLLGDYHKVF